MIRKVVILLFIASWVGGSCQLQSGSEKSFQRYMKKQFDYKLSKDIKYGLVISYQLGCATCVQRVINAIKENKLRKEVLVVISSSGNHKQNEFQKMSKRKQIFWERGRKIFRSPIGVASTSLIYINNKKVDSIHTVNSANYQEIIGKIIQ